jgi:hypothetical protein
MVFAFLLSFFCCFLFFPLLSSFLVCCRLDVTVLAYISFTRALMLYFFYTHTLSLSHTHTHSAHMSVFDYSRLSCCRFTRSFGLSVFANDRSPSDGHCYAVLFHFYHSHSHSHTHTHTHTHAHLQGHCSSSLSHHLHTLNLLSLLIPSITS